MDVVLLCSCADHAWPSKNTFSAESLTFSGVNFCPCLSCNTSVSLNLNLVYSTLFGHFCLADSTIFLCQNDQLIPLPFIELHCRQSSRQVHLKLGFSHLPTSCFLLLTLSWCLWLAILLLHFLLLQHLGTICDNEQNKQQLFIKAREETKAKRNNEVGTKTSNMVKKRAGHLIGQKKKNRTPHRVLVPSASSSLPSCLPGFSRTVSSCGSRSPCRTVSSCGSRSPCRTVSPCGSRSPCRLALRSSNGMSLLRYCCPTE